MKAVTDKYASANMVLKQKQQAGALFIGDLTSAVDKHILKPHKIQTVITIGQDSEPEKKQQNIHYTLHNVLDNKSQKISDLFDPVFQEIQQARKKGGVLVHCYTGISRSSSFVIAYLMRKRFMSYDDAKAFVKKQRNVIQPNDNFHRQLQAYWKVLQKRQQEERLKRQKQQNQKKQKQRQKQIIINESEVLSSNISGLSKRTFRGVKGAVRPAIKQQHSPQNKSIEETAEKSIQKELVAPGKSLESPNSREKSKQGKKSEQKKKEIKGVYANKTKVV